MASSVVAGTPSHNLLAGLTFANFLLLGAMLLRTPARQPPALLARQALRSAPYLAGLYSGSTLALWGAVAWAITF